MFKKRLTICPFCGEPTIVIFDTEHQTAHSYTSGCDHIVGTGFVDSLIEWVGLFVFDPSIPLYNNTMKPAVFWTSGNIACMEDHKFENLVSHCTAEQIDKIGDFGCEYDEE